MRKIVLVLLMNCSFVFGQNSNDSIMGTWYVTSACNSKKVGAWAINPTATPNFCFSKEKIILVSNLYNTLIDRKDVYIENVSWKISSDNKKNRLVCEYEKLRVLSTITVDGNIYATSATKFTSFENKYYWSYDPESEILRIFDDKKLSELLVEFKVKSKSPLQLTKNGS